MYAMKKLNKRLIIVDAQDRMVYSMPSWIRVTDRLDMQWLVDRFNEVDACDIQAIMDFETRHSSVKK